MRELYAQFFGLPHVRGARYGGLPRDPHKKQRKPTAKIQKTILSLDNIVANNRDRFLYRLANEVKYLTISSPKKFPNCTAPVIIKVLSKDFQLMRTIQRNIVGAFILSSDNKLLLGKSIKGGVYPGCWIVPGGGVEPDETKVEAVKRETLEETGIDISEASIEQIEGALSGQSEKVLRETGEKVMVEMKFYNFKVILTETANSVTLTHEDDFIEAEWFSIDELKNLKLSPPTITTLQKLGCLQ